MSVTSGADTLVGLPNATLYIQNLNERARLKDLKKDLMDLFSPFGHIHNIIVKRSLKMKGQAFVVYDNVETATKALSAMQGHSLYRKPMVIRYARWKSDVIAAREGVLEQERQARMLDREERAKQPRLTRRQLMQQYMTAQAMQGAPLMAPATATSLGGTDFTVLPSKILFVQNLPQAEPQVIEERLNGLFSIYGGFKEVRMVPTKRDIAFVEFETELHANTARLAMDRFKITPQQEIRVIFAKK